LLILFYATKSLRFESQRHKSQIKNLKSKITKHRARPRRKGLAGKARGA
jgi:hypothetical protein